MLVCLFFLWNADFCVKTAHHIHVHFPPLLKCSYCSFNFFPPFQHFLLFSLFLHGVFFLSTFSLHHSKILAPFLLPLFTLQVPIKSKCKRNLETHWCHVLFLVDFIREELERHCEVSCCLATGFSQVWDYDAGLTNASVLNGKDWVGKNGPARLLLAKWGGCQTARGLCLFCCKSPLREGGCSTHWDLSLCGDAILQHTGKHVALLVMISV